MNKGYRRLGDKEAWGRLMSLVCLSVCFGVGSLLGCGLASFLEAEAGARLFSYLEGYFAVLESGGEAMPSLWDTFWEVCRWPLFAGLMATTLLGVIALPVLLLVRGLLLSYAVSVFVRLYGLSGIPLAATVFGIPALCSVAALFIIGMGVMQREGPFCGDRKVKVLNRADLAAHLGTIVGWLAAGTAAQYFLSPLLLNWMAALLT